MFSCFVAYCVLNSLSLSRNASNVSKRYHLIIMVCRCCSRFWCELFFLGFTAVAAVVVLSPFVQRCVCVFFYFNNNSYPALLTMVKESLVTRVSSAAVAEASNALGFLKMLHGWGPLEQVEVRLR